MMVGNKNMQDKDMSGEQKKKNMQVWIKYVLHMHVKTAHVNTLLVNNVQDNIFMEKVYSLL